MHSPNLKSKSSPAYIQTGHIGDEETQMRSRKEVEEEEEVEEVGPHQAVRREEKKWLQIGGWGYQSHWLLSVGVLRETQAQADVSGTKGHYS